MRRAAQVVLILIGLLAVYLSATRLWHLYARQQGFDFYIYYVAAHLDGRPDVENIYAPELQARVGEEYYARAFGPLGSPLQQLDAKFRRRLDNVSSPFLYTCFTWLSRDYNVAIAQYRTLLLFSFALAVVLFCHAARVPLTASLFLLAALFQWYFPFKADLIVGNVNAFQLLMIALFVVLGARWPVAGGAIIGLLLSFKPTLGYMLILLVVSRIASRDYQRLRREFLGGALGVVIALTAAAINFGSPKVWLQWIPVAGGFYQRLPGRDMNNVSPVLGLLEQLGSMTSVVIGVLLMMLVALLLFKVRRRDDLVVVSAGVLVYLLSAPVVWLHYLVLAIPAALALMRVRWLIPIALLVLAGLSGEYVILLRKGVMPMDIRVVTVGLLLLFAGLAVAYRRPRLEA